MTYHNYADLQRRKPFRYWYDSIIDWRLANPGRPEQEAAHHFKVTASYYSIIVNSDMFKQRWEQRRREHSSEVSESINRKLLGALDLGLEIVTEQLQKKRTEIPFKDTTAFVNGTLEKLGYGPSKPGTSVNVQVNGAASVPVSITASDLANARELLRRSEAAKLLEAPALAQVSSPHEEVLSLAPLPPGVSDAA